jgi:hypothetical protein
MFIAIRIARKCITVGELCTLISIISPFPAFVSCYQSSYEKYQKIKEVSFYFLLELFMINAVWFAFEYKEDNPEIMVTHVLGMLVALTFISLYIYFKSKVTSAKKEIKVFLMTLPFCVLMLSDHILTPMTGAIAVILDTASYATSFDTINEIL